MLAPLRVELPSLRSLVFTHSMYKSVMDVLDRLSLPEHTLVRLDNLCIPFNSEYPQPIPRNIGRLLYSATALQLAVMLLLEGGPPASALWLQVRHGANTFWDRWLSGLSTMASLGNLTFLHIDLYNTSLLAVLSHTAQLANLFVRSEPDKTSQDGAWMWDGALVPPVAALCTVLLQSEPVECSSLHSIALEWPRHPLIQPNDLGVPDIVAMLSTRPGLGHPTLRLSLGVETRPAVLLLGPALATRQVHREVRGMRRRRHARVRLQEMEPPGHGGLLGRR